MSRRNSESEYNHKEHTRHSRIEGRMAAKSAIKGRIIFARRGEGDANARHPENARDQRILWRSK